VITPVILLYLRLKSDIIIVFFVIVVIFLSVCLLNVSLFSVIYNQILNKLEFEKKRKFVVEKL